MNIDEQRSTLIGYGFVPTTYGGYGYALGYSKTGLTDYPIVYAEDATNKFLFFYFGVQLNTGTLPFLDTLCYVRLAISALNADAQAAQEDLLKKYTNGGNILQLLFSQ